MIAGFLATLAFIVKRVFWFVKDNWKVVVPAILLLIALVFVVRWWNRPPKLDEKAIQKAQQAIAANDRKAMELVLEESDLVEKQIDGNLANAETEKLKSLEESRKKTQQMTNAELAAELERRLNQ